MNYDLSRLVYESLLGNIKKFKDSMKVASMRSMTFGGCHYAFAVSLDFYSVNLGRITV